MLTAQDFDFAGRRVLVTGAASGIGAAMARAFHGHGAAVQVADRDAKGLAEVARDCGGAVAHGYDQADLGSLARLADAAGEIDVLLNNAGVVHFGPAEEQDPAGIAKVIATDLTGPIVLARLVAPGMLARRRGVIVNTASQLAFCGAATRAVYSSAKAGLVQFTKAAAAEWGPRGVRVVALAPGRTLTPLTSGVLGTEAQREEALKHIPYGRFGSAEEMAKLALFLASDAADYVTGETLIADGGYVVAC